MTKENERLIDSLYEALDIQQRRLIRNTINTGRLYDYSHTINAATTRQAPIRAELEMSHDIESHRLSY